MSELQNKLLFFIGDKIMNLRIFENKDGDAQYLKLIEKANGSIHLVVTNKAGDRRDQGCLLYFEDGQLSLHRCISPELGFNLDSMGKLKIN